MKIKNSLLLVMILGGSLSGFSQHRSVDLEVICVSPADTVVNGVGDRLRFGMQNNGPDTLYNQDTVLYWLYVFENDSTGYVVYNGATIGTTAGFVTIGDARYYNDNYAIRFPFPDRQDTFTVEFCVAIGSSYIDGNGDTINPFTYIDPNNENNFCCTKVTIIPKSSSTSIASIAEGALQVYPNPVRDVLYIQTETPVDLLLTDIAGRKVMELQHTRHLPMTDLPAGVYMLQIKSKEGVSLRTVKVVKQ